MSTKKQTEKTKRLKTVFKDKYEVAHVWAQQTQEAGRDRSGTGRGNYGSRGHVGPRIFFKGPRIWSYGYHFELARFVDMPNGIRTVLINNERYGHTTNEHRRAVISAVSHIPHFEVSDFEDLEASARDAAIKIEEECLDLFTKRSFWIDEDDRDSFRVRRLIERAEKYNTFVACFELKEKRTDLVNEMLPLLREHIRECIRIEKDPERLAERSRKLQLRLAVSIENWRAGQSIPYKDQSALRKIKPQLLRVIGDEIQTTGGAHVSLNAAKQLLAAIQKGAAIEGYKIGHYTLTSYNKDLVQIGCHTILLSEAERVLGSVNSKLSLVQGGAK